MTTKIHIDHLIDIVSNGGKVTTGIDIYNRTGILLLDKSALVTRTRVLEIIKENGVMEVPLSVDGKSGLWDANGNLISGSENEWSSNNITTSYDTPVSLTGIEKKLQDIEERKRLALENYKSAKACIKQTMTDIKENGGLFDIEDVYTQVNHLAEFVTLMNNPFSYLTKEIVSYDDYLYNHSINVCTIGTMVMNRFNTSFSDLINNFINANAAAFDSVPAAQSRYHQYQYDEMAHISCGYFLHDIGKVLVPDDILNKSGKLTLSEFQEVRKHSFDMGLQILDKNNIDSPFIANTVAYHHGPLYADEERCYPNDRMPEEIPLYVKICKLADIYDAMTSKRSYKEAVNQINVVTDVFRSYAGKDPVLQHVLHSFIKSVGIYPPGSIVYLRNGQMAYVLESDGPLLLPFTDEQRNCLNNKCDPVSLDAEDIEEGLQIDKRKSVREPLDVWELLPSYLKTPLSEAAD